MSPGLAPKPIPGPVAVNGGALVAARPAEHADATLDDHCIWWEETTGTVVSTATMSRAITALAWTRKEDDERERARRGGPSGLE